MGQRWWLAISCTILAGCNGCDDGGHASPESLYGYWYRDDDPTVLGAGSRTVFGFAPAEDAPYEMQLGKYMLERDPMGKPVSEVFLNDGTGAAQFATYTIEGDRLVQTVLGDVNALPDTMYSTQISAFTPGESMTIVTQEGDEHVYTYAPRCPALQANNAWFTFSGYECPAATVTPIGVSIAIDDADGVHVMAGTPPGDDPFCPAVPTMTDLVKGCEVHQSVPGVSPYLSASVMDAAGKVKIAVIDAQQQLSLLERDPHDDSGATIAQLIDPAPHDGAGVLLVRIFRGDDGTIAIALTNSAGGVHVYREANQFARETVTLGATDQLSDIAMDPATGKFAAIGGANVFREGATANTWDLLTAIHGQDAASIAFVGGAVHVAYVDRLIGSNPDGGGGMVVGGNGVYGVWDDATSTLRVAPLGPLMEPRVITIAGGPREVIATAQNSQDPGLLRVSLADDDTPTVTLPTLNQPFGSGRYPYAHFAVARGPHTVAASYTGKTVAVFDDRLPHAQAATVGFRLTLNAGRGHVVAGPGAPVAFDCTTDCDVDGLAVGGTLPLAVVPDSGFYVTNHPCDPGLVALYGGCAYPITGPTLQLGFGFHPTVVRSVLGVGDANGNSEVFGMTGTHLAFGTVFNPGQRALTIGGHTFMQTVATAAGVAAYDRATGAGWARGTSVIPLSVAAATDGSVWAAFATINAVVTIDGTSYGTSGKSNTVVAHFAAADGALIGTPQVVASTPTSVYADAVAIGADGATSVVVSTNSGNLAALGMTTGDNIGVLVRDASGVVHPTGLGMISFADARVARDGATTAVALKDSSGTTRIVALDGAGAIGGSQTVTGGSLVSLTLAAGRIALVVSATGGAGSPVDLGGGARTDGDGYVALYGATTAAYQAGGVLSQASNYKAIGGLGTAAMFAWASFGLTPIIESGGVLATGTLVHGNYGGTPLAVAPTSDGWLAALIYGGADFDIGNGGLVTLAEMALPPPFP